MVFLTTYQCFLATTAGFMVFTAVILIKIFISILMILFILKIFYILKINKLFNLKNAHISMHFFIFF